MKTKEEYLSSLGDLVSDYDCDNLSVTDIVSLVERLQESMRRKKVLSKHKTPITQLPSGAWYTRVEGKKVQRKTKEALEDYLVGVYEEKANTLETVYEGFVVRRKIEVSDTTWRKDLMHYEKFIKNSHLAAIPLEKITIDDGYDFVLHCLKVKPDLRKKYWDNISTTLNLMFQYAIDRGLIERNPLINVRPKSDLFAPPKKTRDGDTVFTRIEQAKVCQLAEEDAMEQHNALPLGVLLLFNLGLRDGELCALKWRDIEQDHRGKYIHVQREMVAKVLPDGKHDGNKIIEHCKTPAGDRRLHLNSKAIETLERIRQLNDDNSLPTGPDDFILLRKDKGEIVNGTPRGIYARLRKYCKAAGMSVVKSPHDVRRTVLTNLYTAHMPLKKIQEFAGHSSLKQTMDYIRISDDELDDMQFLETLSGMGEDQKIIDFRGKNVELEDAK